VGLRILTHVEILGSGVVQDPSSEKWQNSKNQTCWLEIQNNLKDKQLLVLKNNTPTTGLTTDSPIEGNPAIHSYA
jgi:hypothetical protein